MTSGVKSSQETHLDYLESKIEPALYSCTRHEKKREYKCSTLKPEIITTFREAFYSTAQKDKQDAFILTNCVVVRKYFRTKEKNQWQSRSKTVRCNIFL